MARRDLIGIGGSAGGLPALLDLLDSFEPEAPASLFVVLHRRNEAGHLLDILRRRSPIDVIEPEDGCPIHHGCLHLAPPDTHMLVGDGHVHLRGGPKENNFRPAIDPLFRSLALFGQSRATAVILSGYLDDGAAGCRAVLSTGGRAAISASGEPELIEKAGAIGQALSSLVAHEAGPGQEASDATKLEIMIAGLEKASMSSEDRLGELSPYNCPDCNGVLWRIEDGPLSRFRCHTGHGYTQAALAERQDELLEQSMYDTLRSLREKARMMRDLAAKDDINRQAYLRRAADSDSDAANIERMILQRTARAS